MLFMNRDGIGVPDMQDELASEVAQAFEGADVIPIDEARGFQVRPGRSSAFSVYLFDEMVTADGTEEQNCRVAVLVGAVGARHGVRMMALSPDATLGHPLGAGVSAADLRDASAWRPVDTTTLGRADPFDVERDPFQL